MQSFTNDGTNLSGKSKNQGMEKNKGSYSGPRPIDVSDNAGPFINAHPSSTGNSSPSVQEAQKASELDI